MIQRIQTLFLLLSLSFCLLLMYLPLGHVGDQFEFTYYVYGFVDHSGLLVHSFYLSIVVLLVVIFLQLISILLYKNRLRQVMLAQISLILLVLLAVSVLMSPDLFGYPQKDLGLSLEYNWNTILMIIPWGFTYLAIRRIKKDEALVRSADRMR
ncbi:MAG: DUF4293 family protein [Vicingaceae bacterium]